MIAYELLGSSFLSIITYLGIFVITFIVFLRRRSYDFRASMYLLLIGISFFLLGIITLMYVLGNVFDSMIISAVHTLAWSVLFTLLIGRISGMKKLKYIIFLALISVIIIFSLSSEEWIFLVNFLSYYIAMISFFVLFMFSTQPIKNAGFYGEISIITSMLLTVIKIPFYNNLWAVPSALLIISFMHFSRFGLVFDHFARPRKLEMIERDGEGKVKDVWKSLSCLFTYILLLNIAIFLTTIALHEMGHLVSGNLLGCYGGEIVLMNLFQPENPGPYTLLSCPAHIQENMSFFLGLSGFLFVIPFGLVFLLLRRFPEKNMGLVVFGIGMMLAGLDLILVAANYIITYVSLIVGIILICIGEIFLINDYVSYKRQKERVESVANTI